MDGEQRVAKVFAAQHGAATARQILDFDFTRDMIKTRVRRGTWDRFVDGVFLLSGSPPTWMRTVTASWLAGGEGAAVSHRAAAVLLRILKGQPWVDVTARHGTHNGEQRRFRMHRARTLSQDDVVWVDGICVTCPARTLVDLASVAGRRELARALDAALIVTDLTLNALVAYIKSRRLTHNKGVSRLLDLVGDRHDGVPESELERAFIEVVERFELPVPSRQHEEARFRIDFAYTDRLLMIEVDGRSAHATEEAFQSDRDRQNELVDAGWTVLRFTWKDVTRRPAVVAKRIRSLHARLGTKLGV